MSWVNPGWVLSFSFAGLDESSWSFFGIVEVPAPKGLSLLCGLLVDSPRHEERDLYEITRAAIVNCGFDGSPNSVAPSLMNIASAVEGDAIAGRSGADHGQAGGVHIGGLASCANGALAAFRIGRFRVEGGGAPALIEQTLLQRLVAQQEPLPLPSRFSLFQASDDCLPHIPMEESDIRWYGAAAASVSVEHQKVFGVPSPFVRMSMRARWVQ